MRIPSEFIEGLQRDADIVSVVGQYVELKKAGSNYKGLCPFHNEKTSSFSVNPSKNFYYCFGCQAAGNVVGFLMNIQGSSFVEAIEYLAEQLGREVPRTSSANQQNRPSQLLEQVADHFHANLMTSSDAKNYLKSRGLSKELAKRYRMGFSNANGSLRELEKEAGAKRDLVRVGLLKKGDDGKHWRYFRNRVMFPITNPTGKVLGFGGRLLEDGEPKYLNSPQNAFFDKSSIVYGLHEAATAIREQKYVIVTEGYMDVVSLAQRGIENAVATMGTAATVNQIRQIMTRSEEIVFCFDGDRAGQSAAQKVLRNVMPAITDGKRVKFVLLPQGADPDDIVSKDGPEAFLEHVKNAQTLENFMFAPAQDAKDDASASELWRELTQTIELIGQKKAPFLYHVLYKRLREVSGISVDELREAFRNIQPPPQASAPATPGTVRASGPENRIMKDTEIYQLICCLKLKPELVTKLKGVQLICKGRHSSDVLLANDLVATLANADETDEPDITVERYLQRKRARALLRQIDETAANWKKLDVNVEEKLGLIVKKMNEIGEGNKRKRLRSEQLRAKSI